MSAGKKLPDRVHIKARKLMDEGKTREQAYGEAMGMERAHRLTAVGKYIRAGKKG